MRYDIHFRHGGQITVESKRTLDEIAGFFAGKVDIWGALADGNDLAALVSISDVIAIVPAQAPVIATPARVKDTDGDTWEEIFPGSAVYRINGGGLARTLAEIARDFGPVEVVTNRA